MSNYEFFRPAIEEIVKSGYLESYMTERLSGDTSFPHLDERCGEISVQILWYFAKKYPQIYETARKMLKNLETDNTKAQHREYGWGLSFLLAGHDAGSKEIALDLLLAKGRPMSQEPYFAEETERGLIRLVRDYKSIEFPREKTEKAVKLFSWYIENPLEGFAEISQHAEGALFIADYEKGIKMLSKAIDNEGDYHNFVLAWGLINEQNLVILASDLCNNLDTHHLNYFIKALEFSSGKFQDERSKAFKEEIERLTNPMYAEPDLQ